MRVSGESFDLIVLDPPKFAHTAAHAARAARAYKDSNVQALRLLAPGGLLMSYSCSGGVSPELFQKIVADAALDAKRTARIVQRLQGAADHPVDLAFPEGEYLKGLLLQLD
jgi:23S rRNA (cytosine1962-C5)-methyltransferase